ncbi:hypothetical protein [Ligilactobacillus salivarius]|uniref:Uncharacterized protein n=1 Tax=Ligilactobacillus salivarius TaxID=1624 RepID=A0A1V9R9Z5_9LACO|nr:hypothetical protein [Ligilactobacillus salivarius]OQQ89816.1 hypothetical protein B6U56_08215 [Ligilactobacillus salivarius]HJG03939.1 hypothetical protein [Megamonas funiformis]
MTNNKIRIFLSRPNPFTDNQMYFIKKLKSVLNNLEIETITLQAKDYSPYESLTTLNEMIKRCYGMIILAFGHTYIRHGVLKLGSVERENFFASKEEHICDQWITSPFCQIEGAMAISNNIPIFIIKQENLKSDGILKEDGKISSVSNFSLESTEKIDYFFEFVLIKKIYPWYNTVQKEFNKIEKKIT